MNRGTRTAFRRVLSLSMIWPWIGRLLGSIDGDNSRVVDNSQVVEGRGKLLWVSFFQGMYIELNGAVVCLFATSSKNIQISVQTLTPASGRTMWSSSTATSFSNYQFETGEDWVYEWKGKGTSQSLHLCCEGQGGCSASK